MTDTHLILPLSNGGVNNPEETLMSCGEIVQDPQNEHISVDNLSANLLAVTCKECKKHSNYKAAIRISIERYKILVCALRSE